MRKFAGLAGWAIFAPAMLRVLSHHGPDDLITAQLKAAGLYMPLYVAISVFDVVGLIYLALRRSKRTVPRHRQEVSRPS